MQNLGSTFLAELFFRTWVLYQWPFYLENLHYRQMQLSKEPIFHLPGVTPHPQPLVQRTKALDYAADEHDSMKISIVVWIRHHFSRGKQEINLDLMCAPEELPVSPCRATFAPRNETSSPKLHLIAVLPA